MTEKLPVDRDDADSFVREANRKRSGSFVELLDFLLHNKKWWLTPILVALFLVGGLVILGGSAVAPFIYALF